MRSTVRTAAGLGCATVLLLAGCTSEDPAPTTAATTTAPTSAPTPTPSPTPTATGPMDRSDAVLGIQFEDLPAVTGDARSALDLYTLFEVEFWRSTTEGAMSDLIPAVADPAVFAIVQTQIDGNASRDLTIGGTSRVRFLDVEADSMVATVTTCQDTRDNTVTDADGQVWSGAETGSVPTVISVRLIHEADLPWRVTSYENTGERC